MNTFSVIALLVVSLAVVNPFISAAEPKKIAAAEKPVSDNPPTEVVETEEMTEEESEEEVNN